MGLSFGSDPEFVIVDGHGHPKSAIKVLREYSKDNKLKIGNQSIFWDNVLLEMNLSPARTLDEFQSYFKECLNGTIQVLHDLGDYELLAKASLDFPVAEIDDAEAKVFGCDPEFCIYNRNEENQIMRVEPPVMPDDSTFRSCGGHVHIGHVVANWELGGRPADVIQQMDGLVGIVSVLLDNDPSSLARRKLYGLAGSHRITPYGTEYRTMSNFWFQYPDTVRTIYHLTRKAIEWTLTRDTTIENIVEGKEVQSIINNADQARAKEVFLQYYKTLPYGLGEHILMLSEQKANYPNFTDSWRHVKSVAA